MINKIKSLSLKIKKIIWGVKKRNYQVVIDTCILLHPTDREWLEYLRHVFIPRAVHEQITRMAVGLEAENKLAQNLAVAAESFVLNKIFTDRWKIIGSSGTGLLQSIENKKVSELDGPVVKKIEEIYQRKKDVWNGKRKQLELKPIKFNSELILKDLVGSTDLRIITACLNLKKNKPNQPVVLITHDRALGLLAQTFDIQVKEKVNSL